MQWWFHSWFCYEEIMRFCLSWWLWYWDLDLTVLGPSFCVCEAFLCDYYKTLPLRLIIQLSFSPIGRKGDSLNKFGLVSRLAFFFAFMGRGDWNFQPFSVEHVLVIVCAWRKKALIPFPPKKWDPFSWETWGSEIGILCCFVSGLTKLHLSLLLLQHIELKKASIIGSQDYTCDEFCMCIGNIRPILPY